MQTWALSRQLREEYAKRFAAGTVLDELEADLQGRMLQAAREQFKLSLAPDRRSMLAKAPQASRLPASAA